ncbi:Cell division protein FtsN [Pseudocitrobacter corydidari]|jgi:cell division protein FtsN|uniref:Cell division protein FtsN n=2 Tax=Pseudocitrobacter corydidari TaxID=2891570 RepID=A0ABY3S800_9ENTR|nr:cell division protein FtsN [Enterobacteriaceae bacterium strain FGI 57]UGS42729.1 Cell division protein FtsN [Pseudocitrobacter corydidari]
MVAIAAAVVVAFIGGLYFITHHKKEDSETLQSRQMTGNGLPPKPEERWRYIKELESRQPGVRAPTEPSAGGEVMNPNQLTDEQRQLLAQMQADMRQQPTQLTEVPWNEQTPEQRQQTLQRQRLAQQAQQAQQQQWAQTQPVQQPRAQQQTQQPARQAQTTQQPPRQTQQPKAAASNQQPYQDLLQTPAHTTTSAPKQQAAAPVTRETTPPKATEKKDERRWMVQCGSFKGAEQAETVRAQLAFEGFDSRITTNNGWNRVVIGPIKGKDNADGTLNRLKMAGHGNCIRLASGG